MILCCGEALIDMIPNATQSESEGFVPHCGGAVFNTAIALGRLGIETGIFTGLSNDVFGRRLAEALRANHVETSHVVLSDRPTTLAFVHLTDGQASYSFFDENSALRMLSKNDLPVLSEDISTLFFGGMSLVYEPAAETYAAFLMREAAKRTVMIDPNIRPSFIQNSDRYRFRLNEMMAKADILKMSDEDLNWLFPGPSSLQDKLQGLLDKQIPLLILTQGAKGAVGFLQDGTQIQVSAKPTNVVDTVGAGDTFNAGLLAKLSELGCLAKDQLPNLSADNLRLAIEHAAKVSAITVSRAGAHPPWAEDLLSVD